MSREVWVVENQIYPSKSWVPTTFWQSRKLAEENKKSREIINKDYPIIFQVVRYVPERNL